MFSRNIWPSSRLLCLQSTLVILWTLPLFKGKTHYSEEAILLTISRPQVDVKQMQRILSLIDAGAKEGTVIHGGRRFGSKVSDSPAKDLSVCQAQPNLFQGCIPRTNNLAQCASILCCVSGRDIWASCDCKLLRERRRGLVRDELHRIWPVL